MSDYLFTKDHRTSAILLEWWKNLENNKGDRAELRRCHNVSEIIMTPAYHRIYRWLVSVELPDEPANDRIPVLVALAAQIKNHVPSNNADIFPKALSQKVAGSDRPRLSANRFRSILQLDAPDELLTGLRRSLPLIDSVSDIRDLAHAVYYWGDKIKRRWAYAYDWPARSNEK